MKNTAIFFPAIVACWLFLPFELLSQTHLSECDTLFFRDGRVISADIQYFGKHTVTFNLCPVDSFGPHKVEKKLLEKIRDKEGDMFSYMISPRDSARVSLLVLFGGKRVRGIITDSSEETITLVDLNQFYVTLKRSQIISISTASPTEIIARLDEDNALKTHYLLMSNNFSLNRREKYYQNGMLFYNHAGFGLTNHVSMGVGTLPLLIIPEPGVASWASLKVRIPLGKWPVKLGVGTFALHTTNFDFHELLGYYYGSATVGSHYNNFTVGYGRGAYLLNNDSPVKIVTFGSQLYIAPKLSFLLESLHMREVDGYWLGLNTLCFRLHRKNVTVDIGAICLTDYTDDIFIVSPWLSCTFPFGKK